MYCNKCGSELSEESLFCNKCGSKISELEDNNIIANKETPIQLVEANIASTIEPEVTNAIPKKKSKKIIISLVGIVIILVASFVCYKIYDNHKIKQAKAQLQLQLKQEKLYAANFNKSLTLMQVYLMIIENDCGKIVQAWQDAIENDEDFNDAIQKQVDENNFSQNKDIEKSMDLLQTPPQKFKLAYKSLLDVYGTYKQLAEKASNPSGSLFTYAQDYHKVENEYVEKLSKVQALIPSKYKNKKTEDALNSLKVLLGN